MKDTRGEQGSCFNSSSLIVTCSAEHTENVGGRSDAGPETQQVLCSKSLVSGENDDRKTGCNSSVCSRNSFSICTELSG